MNLFKRLFPISLLLILALAGCALLEPPPRPILPTPVATAQGVNFSAASVPGNPVFDPVSNIVPGIDPDIDRLMNDVSQQQLMGYVQTLESFGTRNAYSATDLPDQGIGAARLWIFNEFVRVGNGRLAVEFDDFPLTFTGVSVPQQNILATLPGTGGNNDVIVVMAHYDTRPENVTDGSSRAPGANDNGSGISLLLETARLMSSRQWSQTVVFAALAAEEQGTFGARHLVQELFLDGVNIVAVINYDTVGGRVGIPQSIRMFAPDLLQSPHGQLARYYNYISGLYVPVFPITVINAADREGRWGDQREFVRAGLPAVRLTESIEDPQYLNSARDSWTVIDYNYLQKVVQLNVAVVANAAGGPARPEPPTIAPMAQEGAFLLSWFPDPAAAGYTISFRPLGSEDYPPFRFVNARDSGNVVLTGLDPAQTYLVSIAAMDGNGRVGLFSPEIPIGP